MVIQLLVRFRYNNCRQSLEVVQPVLQIDISISDIDDIAKVIVLFENRLEMVLQQLVQSWHRQVIVFADCILEFFLEKQIPKCCQFITDLIKDFNVDSSIKCNVEGEIESIPKTIKSEVWLIIILDGLNSRQFSFVDPIHKFLRASTLDHYLLNLVIEKGSFGELDHFLECLPVFQTSCHSILIQSLAALFIPLLLGMLCYSHSLSILSPCLFDF